jgi:hypothetical protein
LPWRKFLAKSKQLVSRPIVYQWTQFTAPALCPTVSEVEVRYYRRLNVWKPECAGGVCAKLGSNLYQSP